jgi:hypothetical protein
MKALLLFFCLVCCLPSYGQNPDALKYAPRPILLLSGDNGAEAVMPMVFTVNGQQHLEFVPSSQIKDSMEKGGQPIRLGDVLAALVDATKTINQLQAENEKLWKVAMKDAPQQPPTPPTVIVQQPPQAPSPLEKYMLLRSMLPQTQNLNVTVRDCTRFPALCVGR